MKNKSIQNVSIRFEVIKCWINFVLPFIIFQLHHIFYMFQIHTMFQHNKKRVLSQI